MRGHPRGYEDRGETGATDAIDRTVAVNGLVAGATGRTTRSSTSSLNGGDRRRGFGAGATAEPKGVGHRP